MELIHLLTRAKKNRATIMSEKSPTFPSPKRWQTFKKMTRIILSLIIGLIIASCTSKNEGDNNTDTKSTGLSKKELYLSKMEKKNFLLEINGPCDDALEDTIHE